MSIITLVRHGQASFFGADYDELSELGKQQCQTLGTWWRSHGTRFDKAFVGPLNRHHQSEHAVAGGYGDVWPAAEKLDGLIEYQSMAVVRHVVGPDDMLAAGVTQDSPETERRRVMRHYFSKYVNIVRQWATGELDVPGVETWRQARLRVADTIAHLARDRNKRLVAFTSGGFVAMAVGELLRLEDEQVFDLSLDIRNTSLTELRLSPARRSLLSYNAIPHLADESRATLV